MLSSIQASQIISKPKYYLIHFLQFRILSSDWSDYNYNILRYWFLAFPACSQTFKSTPASFAHTIYIFVLSSAWPRRCRWPHKRDIPPCWFRFPPWENVNKPINSAIMVTWPINYCIVGNFANHQQNAEKKLWFLISRQGHDVWPHLQQFHAYKWRPSRTPCMYFNVKMMVRLDKEIFAGTNFWELVLVGEELPCQRERANSEDPLPVAVTTGELIVGQEKCQQFAWCFYDKID